MLSNKFLQFQKKILETEKKQLEEKISQLKKFPNYGNNEDDNARELTDFESNLSLEEQLKYLLNKINIALLAIQKGTYGKCCQCSENIEEGRLKIMPYAEYCITCRKIKDKE